MIKRYFKHYAGIVGVLLALIGPVQAQMNWEAVGKIKETDGLGGPASVVDVDAAGTVYVGGGFRLAGGVVVNHVTQWKDGRWQPLDNGVPRPVHSLVVGPDGAVYVALESASGTPDEADILRWDGTAWTPLATRANIYPRGLAFDADGALYAFGEFRLVASGNRVIGVHRWKAGEWSYAHLETGKHAKHAFAVAPDGTRYVSTNDEEIYRLGPGETEWENLSLPKQEIASVMFVTKDGTLYVDGLELQGGLKRFRNQTWERIDAEYFYYLNIRYGPDGNAYANVIGPSGRGVCRFEGETCQMIWSYESSYLDGYVYDYQVTVQGAVVVVGSTKKVDGVPVEYAAFRENEVVRSLGTRVRQSVSHVVEGQDGTVMISVFNATTMDPTNLYRLVDGEWEPLGRYVPTTTWDGNTYDYTYTSNLFVNPNGQLMAAVGPSTLENRNYPAGSFDEFLIAWDGASWKRTGQAGNTPLVVPYGAQTLYANIRTPGVVGSLYLEPGNGQPRAALVGEDGRFIEGIVQEVKTVGGTLWVGGDLRLRDSFTPTTTSVQLARWDGRVWVPAARIPPDAETGDHATHETFEVLQDGRIMMVVRYPSNQGNRVAFVGDGTTWQRETTFGNVRSAHLAVTPDGSVFFSGKGACMACPNLFQRWDGTTWSDVENGPDGPISSMYVGPSGYLYVAGDFETVGGVASPGVARWGGGRFVATDPVQPALPTLSLSSYPNPFTALATVRYGVPEAGAVRLAVYDVLGREVAVLADGVQPSGVYEVPVTSAGLAPGVYLARLAVGGQQQTLRMTVAR